MFDGIEYRGFGQSIVEDLAKYSGKVVWNGLTNEYHPTQMLAYMLTIREHFGNLKGLKLVYFGDARYNIGNSLCIVCSKLGLNLTLCAPEKYFPNASLVKECEPWCRESGATITLESDVDKAAKDADVMKKAKPTAIFMHDLPSFHDLNTKIGREVGEKFGLTAMEVTDEVFESEQSVVFDEAENRMHTIKAVIAATLGSDF